MISNVYMLAYRNISIYEYQANNNQCYLKEIRISNYNNLKDTYVWKGVNSLDSFLNLNTLKQLKTDKKSQKIIFFVYNLASLSEALIYWLDDNGFKYSTKDIKKTNTWKISPNPYSPTEIRIRWKSTNIIFKCSQQLTNYVFNYQPTTTQEIEEMHNYLETLNKIHPHYRESRKTNKKELYPIILARKTAQTIFLNEFKRTNTPKFLNIFDKQQTEYYNSLIHHNPQKIWINPNNQWKQFKTSYIYDINSDFGNILYTYPLPTLPKECKDDQCNDLFIGTWSLYNIKIKENKIPMILDGSKEPITERSKPMFYTMDSVKWKQFNKTYTFQGNLVDKQCFSNNQAATFKPYISRNYNKRLETNDPFLKKHYKMAIATIHSKLVSWTSFQQPIDFKEVYQGKYNGKNFIFAKQEINFYKNTLFYLFVISYANAIISMIAERIIQEHGTDALIYVNTDAVHTTIPIPFIEENYLSNKLGAFKKEQVYNSIYIRPMQYIYQKENGDTSLNMSGVSRELEQANKSTYQLTNNSITIQTIHKEKVPGGIIHTPVTITIDRETQ